MIHYYRELLSEDFINNLIQNGDLVDARNGGLVLGNSHNRGGIKFLLQFPEGYRVYGEIEGFEYILSHKATIENKDLISEINNYKRDYSWNFKDEEFNIESTKMIIDARKSKYESKYIICDNRDGFAIINKHSTKKYLDKLDEINEVITELKANRFQQFVNSISCKLRFVKR